MLVTCSLPEFNLKKQMYSSWAFHVDDRSESSITYDMIISQDLLGELGIIMNFNDHTVTWDTENWHYSNERQRYSTLSSVEFLIEILCILVQMNHKRSEMNILQLPKS
jgi:hypothetical protein